MVGARAGASEVGPPPAPESLVVSVTRDSLRVLHLDFRSWETQTQYECEVVVLPDHPGVEQPSRGTLLVGDSLSFAVEREPAISGEKRVALYRFGIWKQWIGKAHFTLAIETGRKSGIRRVVYSFRPGDFLFGR